MSAHAINCQVADRIIVTNFKSHALVKNDITDHSQNISLENNLL